MGEPHTNAAPEALWTDAERAWAEDCFSAGDEIAEIANAAGRTFLDVATALRATGFLPLGRRWSSVRQGGGGSLGPSRWVGGMLREVAVYRRWRGETAIALASEAQVSPRAMRCAIRQARTRSEAA